MKNKKNKISNERGFSLIEMTIAMIVVLVLMGLATTLFASALSTRARESRKVDALTAARAAITVISRELANSGYGLSRGEPNRMPLNGIVNADSNANRIHFRSNVYNSNTTTCEPGEDVTYFFDEATKSIVRYDRYPNVLPDKTKQCDNTFNVPETSVVVNGISKVIFKYINFSSTSTGTETDAPTDNTGRIRITVYVDLEDVPGQPRNQRVTFTSEVTLRNSNYMLNQY